MRLGTLEIILIIAVIIIVVIIGRIIRTGRNTTAQNNESSKDIPERPLKLKTRRLHGFIQRTGIALVLAGIILILFGISMFQWALQSYTWSFIVTAVGFVLVLLSRNKR